MTSLKFPKLLFDDLIKNNKCFVCHKNNPILHFTLKGLVCGSCCTGHKIEIFNCIIDYQHKNGYVYRKIIPPVSYHIAKYGLNWRLLI